MGDSIFADLGFLTASQFSRLSAERLKALKPVTVVLDGNKPVAVAVEYNTFLAMQEAADFEQITAEVFMRARKQTSIT